MAPPSYSDDGTSNNDEPVHGPNVQRRRPYKLMWRPWVQEHLEPSGG